jgi:hypothetical protein
MSKEKESLKREELEKRLYEYGENVRKIARLYGYPC